MAVRSPGIYYNEIDNTQYTNPKSVSGTTLAVVGYAKKGPINVPTEINSWKDYIDVFGEPVSGMYSGLAVKNFLSSGGTVLFDRVANKDLIAPSNYIVKNGKPAEDGYAFFDKEGDVLTGDENYKQEKIYNFKLGIGKGIDKKEKYFLIRTPKEGKRLTQSSIVEQIHNQIDKTNAVFETKINDSFQDHFYGFNVEVDGEKLSNNDFYLETSQEKNSKELFIENLKSVLKQTNAITTLDFSEMPNAQSDDVDMSKIDYGEQLQGEKRFKVTYGNQEPKIISVEFGASGVYLEKIAELLNTKMKEIFGIRVFAVPGDHEQRIHNKLVFVDLNRNIDSKFEIGSIETAEASENDLFLNQESEEWSGYPNFAHGSGEDNKHLFITRDGYKVVNSEINNNFKNVDIKFDNVTKDLIITNVKTSGPSSTIKFVNNQFAEKANQTSLFDIDNGLFHHYFTLDGQEKIEVKVEVDKDTKKIKFSNSNVKPVISEVTPEDDYFEDARTHNYEILDFIKIEGIGLSGDPKQEIKSESRDKVIFTSKEKGSGTNNIAVEVYTVQNPLDGTKKRTLIVYSNGNIEEKYEDISTNYLDIEHRFDTVINAEVDNGGSAFIHVTVKKDCFSVEELKDIVELPDGIWKLGQPNKEGDRAKEDGTLVDSYDAYEYMVGNDGIPEDDDNNPYTENEGSYLFQEAMDPVNSPLANKDLYDFHILIAPDDITSIVQDSCIKLCETRGDAITIVDPPVGLNKEEVIDWHNGRRFGRTAALDSNYAATYWPWCKVLDTSTGKGKFTWVMPSIIMASQYVRVDRTAGCQIAPAGETNGMLPVIDIERYPNPTDRDDLYVDYNRINPICKFKDGTIVAYGEKTTQRKESVLTKIHTRRMLIQIKKQCKEALRGYLFMPNTTDYLGKISNNVTAILESYKANGGLNFYKVICDETNNPTEIRQQDIINVDIVLVPQGTIEQINISLTLNKTAETVTD